MSINTCKLCGHTLVDDVCQPSCFAKDTARLDWLLAHEWVESREKVDKVMSDSLKYPSGKKG